MTAEEYKKEVENKYAIYYKSDDCHCDVWQVFKYTTSPNRRVVAYVVNRLYENYHYPYDQSYNELVVCNLETKKEKVRV